MQIAKGTRLETQMYVYIVYRKKVKLYERTLIISFDVVGAQHACVRDTTARRNNARERERERENGREGQGDD